MVVARGAGRVTVVVTAHNEEPAFLAEAVESVRAQSIPPDEILIVEDGAKRDYSTLWARYPDLRIHRQPNSGPSGARNAGLRLASGEFILFLDGDDRLTRNALAISLARFAAEPHAAMAFGGFRLMDAQGAPSYQPSNLPPEADRYAALLKANVVGMHGTVLYRRAALLAAGGFDERLWGCEDWEVFLRLSRSHWIAHSPEILAEYRQHRINASSDRPMMLSHLRRMLDIQAPFVAERPEWRAAADEGWASGKRFYARQQYADLLNARNLRAIRGFLRFWLSMPGMMAGVLAEEIGTRFRRPAGRTAVACKYVEDFVARNAGHARGDVLAIDGAVPDTGSHDCVIQRNGTGSEAEIAALHARLRPGGALLLAVPAARIDRALLERRLEACFDPCTIDVNFYGNAKMAQPGLCAEAVNPLELYALDCRHPVVITASARKEAA